MAGNGNIVIADESALYAFAHDDWADRIQASLVQTDPLQSCASTLRELRAFNVHHPLYGPPPISLLVRDARNRRRTDEVTCRCVGAELPPRSFFALREGLYMATPELIFIRLASNLSEAQLALVGVNLCSRYYLDVNNGEIRNRARFLTTPEKLQAYARVASPMRGSRKALAALRWVMSNSGSPEESMMMLQFCLPVRMGGFRLPFKAMNYDVKAGRNQGIVAQGRYSIDLADPETKTGMEYDGERYHLDASADKRRRNELKALGWDVFPLDKHVLHDPDATVRAGEQIAKYMGVRLRRPSDWERRFINLRVELGLPI